MHRTFAHGEEKASDAWNRTQKLGLLRFWFNCLDLHLLVSTSFTALLSLGLAINVIVGRHCKNFNSISVFFIRWLLYLCGLLPCMVVSSFSASLQEVKLFFSSQSTESYCKHPLFQYLSDLMMFQVKHHAQLKWMSPCFVSRFSLCVG